MRHESFRDAGAAALLREHGVALVLADSAGTWPVFDEATASFAHVRLHGHDELCTSGCSPAALDAWAERVRAWCAAGLDAHVHSDDDAARLGPGADGPTPVHR